MSALTIRIDPDLDARLAQAALYAGTTKSELIRQAITEKIARTVSKDEQARLWAEEINRKDPEFDEFFTEI